MIIKQSVLPKLSSLLFSILYLIIFIIFLFLNVSDVQAVATYTDVFSPTNPGFTTQCMDRSGCDRPEFCWNSQSVGVTDCGPACTGGDPWTKYQYLGCFQRDFDPAREVEDCVRSFVETQDAVCSTADKCTSTTSNPYLNSGSCSCTTGGVYKTCCTNTTPSYLASDSCVQIAVDTTNPPWEGVCPGGTHSVQCGFGSNPACGQAACGVLPPPLVCGATCTYPQTDGSGNVTCHSGNCTDGSTNCSFNSNCSYVTGCSSGATVTCPAGPAPAAAPASTIPPPT